MGEYESSAVGLHQGGPEDRNGFLLHQLLLRLRVWLPATFPHSHHGEGGTWYHPRGHYTRNDFIGLPDCWRDAEVHSHLEEEVDISLSREDHRAVTCLIKGSVMLQPQGRLKPLTPKRDLPPGPATRDKIDQIARNIPWVSWNTNIDEHANLLAEGYAKGLQKMCKSAKKVPWKPAMSDTTWEMVQRKKGLRNLLGLRTKVLRLLSLSEFFLLWKTGQKEPRRTFRHELDHALLWRQFQELGKLVTAALVQDNTIFCERLIDEGKDASESRDHKRLWRLLKRNLPKHQSRRNTLNPLRRQTLEEQWGPHFKQLEIGHDTAPEDLVHRYAGRVGNLQPKALPRTDVPSLLDVEDSLRNSTPDRAGGPDGLQPELFCRGGDILGPQIWDLFVKVFLTQREPLGWKGGYMVPIYKKGPENDAANYRGILLASCLPKRFHALVRRCLTQRLNVIRPSGQLGGFPHSEVLFGTHALRTLARIGAKSGFPTLSIFLDLKNAFHHLVRNLVVGSERSGSFDTLALIQALQHSGLDVRGLLLWLEEKGISDRLYLPEFVTDLVSEIHQDTFFTVPGHPQPIRTTRGSRPGSPIADATFHLLMTDIQVEMEAVMEQEGQHHTILEELNIEAPPITWADDVALLSFCRTNEELIPLAQSIGTRLFGLFERRGFTLNLARGKTGVVLACKGAGAASTRRELLTQPVPGVSLLNVPEGQERWLHFTDHYTHLGSVFEQEGGLSGEINHRIGLAWSSFQTIKKSILCSKAYKVDLRLQLFETLIGTKLWFGTGTWGALTDRLLAKLDTITMKMIRMVVGEARGERTTTTDATIRARFLIPSARTRLARDRLLYAGRLYQFGPPFLLRLLEKEASLDPEAWLHCLHHDLAWLQKVRPNDTRWPRDFNQLREFWHGGAPQWKSIVKSAIQRHLHQEATALEVRLWHSRCITTLKDAGTTLEGLSHAEILDHHYTCHCGTSFLTLKGLAVHRWKKHQIHAPERQLAQSASCPVCLRFFWTTQRMQQHLAYAPRGGGPNLCYEQLLRLQPDHEALRVDERVPKEVAHFRRLH